MHSSVVSSRRTVTTTLYSTALPQVVKSPSISEKSNASKLIKDPIKLQLYKLLMSQQPSELRSRYKHYKAKSLSRESEDYVLLDELFDYSQKRLKAEGGVMDVIVEDKSNYMGSKVNFATDRVSKSEFSELRAVKEDENMFSELIRQRHESYMLSLKQNPGGNHPITEIKEQQLSENCSYGVLLCGIKEPKTFVRSSIFTEDEEVDNDCRASDIFELKMVQSQPKPVFNGLHSINHRTMKYCRETCSTLASSTKSTLKREQVKNSVDTPGVRRIRIDINGGLVHL